jgi:hypothetical protein
MKMSELDWEYQKLGTTTPNTRSDMATGDERPSTLRRFLNGADDVDLNEVQAGHDVHTLRSCIDSLRSALRSEAANRFVVRELKSLIEAREELHDLIDLIENPPHRIAAE